MATMTDMIEGIKRADALLSDADLEPREGRDDWAGAKKKIDDLRAVVEGEIAAAFDDALAEAEDSEIAPLIRRRTARLYADTAAVLQASGDALSAAKLLAKAERAAGEGELSAELAAAQKEPAVFARLTLARWLLQDGRFAEADREAGRVRNESKQPALVDIARKLLEGPRPLSGGPPPLFTLNGFGTSLFGKRDSDDEGRYVATYCICLLFIPVLPLAAYRVKQLDRSSYRFFAKERLSPLARGAQALFGLAVAGAVVGYAASGYLNSPERRAEAALVEARAVEKSGNDERAIESYRKIVDQYAPQSAAVREAAVGVGRLAAKGIPAPCTPESVEPARRAANAFLSLRELARAGASATDLVKRLDACATEIGAGDPEKVQASLRVLDLAVDVAKGGEGADLVAQRRASTRRAFALQKAASRPLFALYELTREGDAESVAAAKKILTSFGDGPSLWLEAALDIEKWAKNARAVNDEEGSRQALAKLAAARTAHESSEKLIAANDEKAVEKAAGEHPEDQELAIALAHQRRSHGDDKGALALIEKLGPPGRLTASAQQLLSNLHADAGDLVKADEILTALSDERLPAFQDAQRAFNAAAESVEQRVMQDLNAGTVPPDLEKRLEGVLGDDRKRDEIHAWVAEKVEADPTFAAVRADYLGRGPAVSASLALGLIKVRRAAGASGDERKQLLDQAERAFLAIRDEAAGEPAFHLGLGQVYFRLGKNEDGERELQSVIERKVPALTLSVARTYRELGLYSSARKVARGVYDGGAGDPRAKNEAADLLAHLATDVDEEEEWLRRADTSDPAVRTSLDRVAGERLLRDGKLAEADRQFKKCVDFYDHDARVSPVSANNAATETMRRYDATGDPVHLKTAVNYLETAAKLDPDNALVLGNLAAVLAQLGYVTVLDKWVDTRTLILDLSALTSLASSLIDGPLAAEVIDALRKDPSFQKSLETSKKQQILAPQMRHAYGAELSWLGWNRDVKGLEDLEKRTSLLPASSDTDADLRQKWLAGERDEAAAHDAKAAVSMARQRVERAKSAAKPTQATALLTLSRALQQKAFFERDAAMLDEIADAARKAQAAWPEGATRSDVSSALLASVFYRAVEISPALKKAWEDERRKLPIAIIAFRAASGPSGPEITAALRKDPAFAEAASVRKKAAAESPTLNDFLFARLTGDADLEKAAMKAFDRRDLDLYFANAARLDPSDEEDKLLLELFRARGAAK